MVSPQLGLGRSCLLGERDPQEQRLCGRVERVSKGQRTEAFSEGGRAPKPLSGRFWSFRVKPCRGASKWNSSPNRNDKLWLAGNATFLIYGASNYREPRNLCFTNKHIYTTCLEMIISPYELKTSPNTSVLVITITTVEITQVPHNTGLHGDTVEQKCLFILALQPHPHCLHI